MKSECPTDPFEGKDPYEETKPGAGKQDTPIDQMKVVLMAMEGWMQNLEEGISSKEKVISYWRTHLSHLHHLVPYLKKGSW